MAGLPPRSVVLAGDETDLRLFPPLRAGWSRRGRTAPVPITGANAKRVLFGAINVLTGRRLLQARPRGRAADGQAFLRHLRWHYRGWHVALLWDEDSCHTAGGTRSLADELGLELLWLPKRSPHLNPMDHLWRHGKGVMLANHQYGTIEDQAAAVIGYLEGLPALEALDKAGILSGNFWLFE